MHLVYRHATAYDRSGRFTLPYADPAVDLLLVPLMRDFQKRLNNAAVCRYTDELMHLAAQEAAKYR